MKYLFKLLLSFLLILTLIPLKSSCVFAVETTNNKGFIKVMENRALKEDGSLWNIPSFDYGEYKKIGEGYVDFTAGPAYYLAVKRDGTLWACGSSYFGLDGLYGLYPEKNIEESDTPIKIMDNVKSVSGFSALKKDGSVWVWGIRDHSPETLKKNKLQMIYQGAKAIDNAGDYVNVIDNKGTLYSILNNPNLQARKSLKNISKIAENVISIKSNYFIKSDKTLWHINISSDGKILGSTHILNNVKFVNLNCAVKQDGTLFLLHGDGYPQRIMSGVKYAYNSIRECMVIKNDGSICSLGYSCPISYFSLPRTALKNVKKLIDHIALTNDNMLLSLKFYNGFCTQTKIGENVKDIYTRDIKDPYATIEIENLDGSRWVFEYGTLTKIDLNKEFVSNKDHLYLDNSGTIWRKSNSIPPFQKVASDIDNIKDYFAGPDCVYIIKNDKSLWMYKIGEKAIKLCENVKELFWDKTYSGNPSLYLVKDDNSLWILKAPSSIYDASRKFSDAHKILDDVKEVNLDMPINYAITNSGKLWAWSESDVELFYNGINKFKLIVDDVVSFDINENPYILGIRKSDGSRYRINNYIDITKQIISDLYLNKANELCLNIVGQSDNSNGQNNSNKLIKILDNVVSYNEINKPNALEILVHCEDGSLWRYNRSNKGTSDNSISDTNARLEKIFDNIKKYGSDYAILDDGSLYTWGSNDRGILGNGTEESSDKPQKILDDVNWVSFSSYFRLALKNDGTLLFWGDESNPSVPSFHIDNPMNLGTFNDSNKIQHYNYEAVGINEDIDVAVKIKDSSALKNAKIILDSQIEIPLEKNAGDYYSAVIPGLSKMGVISYHFSANENGNIINSKEYTVEVISKDRIIIDSNNDELTLSNNVINLNGSLLAMNFPCPVIKEGRVLVPVRALSEALNFKVLWDGKSKTVSITKNNTKILVKIGEKTIKVGKNNIKTDVAALIAQGSTFLPLRAISEALGAKVNWDSNNKIIEITTSF
ncbi:stalk domain-containing protein [Pseudobacteroides cellulosolvens]|uniref:Copper amine oxidase-like domain-containing protein n=2 Tax=Pseudobacteroides cellulosolvens TaxID=35825 RepID=A0A0L6JQI4_9FIRM|nr:stalk domain-containing protein [Pseudobacteroides cellulosolvens]KNY27627.1 copper amine oxidase-like domain-containing protein [Pseudobacteroides cellulosolvens ATCC 35603 = DSM 2933]